MGRTHLALATAVVVVVGGALLADDHLLSARDSVTGVQMSGCKQVSRQPLAFPSLKGLNYGTPPTATGDYVGLEWLRAGTESRKGWPSTLVGLKADLDFIRQHDLGGVIRLFIGLDQLMSWDRELGFTGFDQTRLDNFQETLDVLQSHSIKIVGVIYDQEDTASLGNFHFEALDGFHPVMREGYLRAIRVFLQRFGTNPTIIGWDLFNEAYNSLGTDGGLPTPPAASPVSPRYSAAIVHAWIRDLYQVARCAAPTAWFTISDTTELYWKSFPDLTKYDEAVDFYDIHVYDDQPRLRNWQLILNKPVIFGEVAASIDANHYQDQAINPRVVGYVLQHANQTGIKAVLAHAADNSVYSRNSNALTATGLVIACFGASRPAAVPCRRSGGTSALQGAGGAWVGGDG